MLTAFLAVSLAAAVEVERVLALVNGAPILSSDVDLAEAAQLVPRDPGEDDASFRRAELEALIALQLRWQDLESAAIASRTTVDIDAAWHAVVTRVGGEEAMRERLRAIGLPESAARELVRRAAIVQAYVSGHFAPFVRPTRQEVEDYYANELTPELRKQGKSPPPLEDVRAQIEELIRQRKLLAEVQRWTADLAKRGQVLRYLR